MAASLDGGDGDGEGQRVIHGALRFEGVADPTFPPELRKLTLALVDEFENLQVRGLLCPSIPNLLGLDAILDNDRVFLRLLILCLL